MTIKAGDKVPAVKLKSMTKDGIKDFTTDDIFKGKKVAIFGLPGAFTPTCSAKHLPGFVNHYDALKAKGVDTVACVSVNDAFVMDAWGKAQNVGDKVMMLADGNADFAKALGIEMDGTGFGDASRLIRPLSGVQNADRARRAVGVFLFSSRAWRRWRRGQARRRVRFRCGRHGL